MGGSCRLIGVVAVALASCGLGSAPAAAATVDSVWVRPVPGAVTRPFAAPRTRFGAGHLGADLDAPPASPVRAAGAGTVTFAGSVAGSLHVVVAHDGDLRTSYSFLASIGVRRGERVPAGAVVGTSGGTGTNHDHRVLHFGLRTGTTYVDPMVLFQPPDLTEIVHLVPTHEHGAALAASDERRGLLDGLRGAVGDAIHVTASAFGAAGQVAAGAPDALGRLLVARVRSAAPPGSMELAAGALTWVSQRGRCAAHAPPADGSGGSGHRVLMVAGIDSHGTGAGPTLPLPASALGYRSEEVSYFSYASDRAAYDDRDTHAPLLASARRLGDQLRELQRAEPGREVDLLAHSQGGVIVLAFLTLVYDRRDAEYPPLGTVVTLSSPLAGAPLATAGAEIGRTDSGHTALQLVDTVTGGLGLPVPPALAPSVRDLAADSDLMRHLDDARLPDQVELTTVGALTDPVVPANVATRSGAKHTVVRTGLFNAHTAVLSDTDSLQAVRAALERRPLPCRSWSDTLEAAVIPTAISRIEHRVGDAGALAGALVDAAR